MATEKIAVPMSAFPITYLNHEADRRREPRFGAEGEVAIVVDDGSEKEITAKLLDFSLHGLRVKVPTKLPTGTDIRVLFSWGEVATQVVRCAESPSGFEIGLQLF